MDQSDLLDKFRIPTTFQDKLKEYFLPKQVAGDDYCYYGSIFEGIMHGLNEDEIVFLELNGIVDTKSFHSKLADYFESKNGDKQDSIYVIRNDSESEIPKEVPVTDRIRKSLLEGPSCADSWGTTDMNDIVSGFFYERFEKIQIEILSLFQTKEGWRWNRRRNTEIKVRSDKVLHIFLLKSAVHFDALLPKKNKVLLPYSFTDKKSDKKTEDDIVEVALSEDESDTDSSDDVIDLTNDTDSSDDDKRKKRKARTRPSATGLGKYTKFDSSDDSDTDSSDTDSSDTDSSNDNSMKYDYKRKKRKTVRALSALKF